MPARQVTLLKVFIFLLGLSLVAIGLQGVPGSAFAAIFAPQALNPAQDFPGI